MQKLGARRIVVTAENVRSNRRWDKKAISHCAVSDARAVILKDPRARMETTRGCCEFSDTRLETGDARGHATKVETENGGEARSGRYPRCAEPQADEDLTAFVCTRGEGGRQERVEGRASMVCGGIGVEGVVFVGSRKRCGAGGSWQDEGRRRGRRKGGESRSRYAVALGDEGARTSRRDE